MRILPLLEQCDLRCQGAAFIRAAVGVLVLMIEVGRHHPGGLIGKTAPLPRRHDTLHVLARRVHEYGEMAIDCELSKRGDFLDRFTRGIPAIVPSQQITHEIARVLKHDHLIGPDLREEMQRSPNESVPRRLGTEQNQSDEEPLRGEPPTHGRKVAVDRAAKGVN